MKNLNFILEVVNGVTSILLFFSLTWLTFHLYDLRKRTKISWLAMMLGVSGGLSMAVYLYFEQIGTMITRTVVWVWRMQGGNVAFSDAQQSFLLCGACFTAVGLLLMIRLLSKPRFGNGPWMSALITAVGYVILRTGSHLFL